MKQYPKYKDSGVQWIGEIPEHWEVLKISRAFRNISSGTTPNTEIDAYYNNGTINWVNTGDLNDSILLETKKKITQKAFDDYSTLKLYPEGSLIVAMYGATIGKVSITAIEATTNQACCVLAESKRILSKYAFYWFLVNKENIVSLAYGGGQPNISQDLIRKLKIIAPPFSEQTAIASFLDHKTSEIDQLIAAKEELIAKLEAQRKAIINETVTGQAYKTGLIPTPDGKEVKFKDSGIEWLGEIPEHWEAVKLKFLTRKIVDGTHFTPTYIESGIPFLRVTDIQSENINLDEVKFISEEEHNELKKRCNPEKGDVLLSKNGTIGITKVIDWDFEFSIFVSLCLIKFGDRLLPEFFSFFFKSNIVDQQIMEGSKTTSVTNLHLEKINELLQILPTIDEQKLIIEYLNRFTKNIEYLVKIENQSIEKLKLYKQSLISEAVTGKIDVRDWQKD